MYRLREFGFAVLAGISIAIGGAAFLTLENKVLGALFFTFGLFVICTFKFNLFTGKVCYLFENPLPYVFDVLCIWLGNFVGTWLTAMLFRSTRIAGIEEKAQVLCQVKLDDSLLSIFILGIFCNILIYVAVDGFNNNPHELGKYLSLFFGVTVFVLCGFEHCVANMFYFSMANMWSMKAFGLIAINTLGNAVGGVFIPVMNRLLQAKKV